MEISEDWETGRIYLNQEKLLPHSKPNRPPVQPKIQKLKMNSFIGEKAKSIDLR